MVWFPNTSYGVVPPRGIAGRLCRFWGVRSLSHHDVVKTLLAKSFQCLVESFSEEEIIDERTVAIARRDPRRDAMHGLANVEDGNLVPRTLKVRKPRRHCWKSRIAGAIHRGSLETPTPLAIGIPGSSESAPAAA